MNNLIKINIEGNRVSNYVKWLIKEKINIYSLNIINPHKLELLINYKDLNRLKKYSKTYEITIIKKYGKLRIKEIIKNNIVIFISMIISLIFIYLLSNIIFNIEIITNNNTLKKTISSELANYNIKKYKLKPSKEYLDEIEKLILNNNKDTIEWLEIIENGTKYTIKLVERKKKEEINEYQYQSISISKNAIITKIIAYSGEKTKDIGEYAKANEIIINGLITKPNGEFIYNKARGLIYGEIWYKISIDYPLYYQEEKTTGKSKKILMLNFLNKKIPIFPYKKYKQFKTSSNKIVKSNLIPLFLSIENIYEVITKEEIYTIEEATSKAIFLAKKKLQENNPKIININDVLILSKENLNSKIKLNLFISVTEDITKIVEIKEEKSN